MVVSWPLQSGGNGYADVIAGTNTQQNQYVTMPFNDDNTNSAGLDVIYASNQEEGAINATGVLTLVMNRAVELADETQTIATVVNTVLEHNVVGAETHAALAPEKSIAATVSEDGMTVTITPDFEDETGIRNADGDASTGTGGDEASGAPTASDAGETITYNGGLVCIKSTNICTLISNLNHANGSGQISTTVKLIQN